MSNNIIKLSSILQEILNEVGDLDNLDTYKVVKVDPEAYKFDINEDLSVEVIFENDIDPGLFKSIKIPTNPKLENTYNVGYTVNGVDTQAKKMSYSTLIKTLKTICEIVLEFVKTNPSIEAMMFLPMSKTGQNINGTLSDPQKYELYKTILIKNIGKLTGNWNYGQYKLLNIKMLAVFKK